MTVEQLKQMVPTDTMAEDMKKKKANDIIMQNAIGVALVEEPTEEKPAAKKTAAKKTSKKAEAQTEAAAE